jgi:hypothetical protein
MLGKTSPASTLHFSTSLAFPGSGSFGKVQRLLVDPPLSSLSDGTMADTTVSWSALYGAINDSSTVPICGMWLMIRSR